MAQNIIISGIPELNDALGTLSAFRFLRTPITRWAYRIQNRLATYPGPIPSGLFMRTATEKQRKAFFALLSEGRIPGARTGDLGRSWEVDVSLKNDEIKAEIGTNREHAKFVQGSEEDQQPFHAGRWESITEVTEMFEDRIVEDIQREIINHLSSL